MLDYSILFINLLFPNMQDPTAPQRHIAVRIKILPKGTVFFENILPGKQRGVVDKIPENLVSVWCCKKSKL